MKIGDRVRITGTETRRGMIGTYAGPENTAIGELHRVEFEYGEAGLYRLEFLAKIKS